MTDGRTIPEVCWDARLNPEDPVDRAILATRRATFPLFGHRLGRLARHVSRWWRTAEC